MKPTRLLLLAGLLCIPALAQPVTADSFDLRRPEIASFITDVAARNGMSKKELRRLLKAAQPQPKIIAAMERPAEKVSPWWQYRENFVTAERIAQGVQFWNEHKDALERSAAQYQVAPEYIVGILGVETKYGRITGHYRVLDALATLAFDYPPRHVYFTKELEQFLILARENKLDPLTLTGSYAGAMGAPQFMPSSYRHYAIDANGDHVRDLWADWDDVIASVANYLHESGWRPGAPVLAEASIAPEAPIEVDPRNLEPKETVATLAARGIRTEVDVPPETPALLISAEQEDGPAYRVGFHNFFVITRYNTSPRYAMAVHDLAQAVVQQLHNPAASPAPAEPTPPPAAPAATANGAAPTTS
ncbi:MAG: lytic murein transglycosylase B [Proteobacteria bacterium]|nr:lytic murein transglycosylase B [Pseudomonadota bacterium]